MTECQYSDDVVEVEPVIDGVDENEDDDYEEEEKGEEEKREEELGSTSEVI